ncbi:MAG: rhodanese-like domain-containing protein [Deltaproteobacteria bacterium]|nr:rhodanese-like domain-containing protein [Deltaproteobacteria bacterium]
MRRGRIDLLRLRQLLDEGALLLDVRTPGEFDRGHIPGARNVPVAELGKSADLQAEAQRPVVVYCHSGARSALAARQLRRLGRTHVYDFGSVERWTGPLERTPPPAPEPSDEPAATAAMD